MCLLDTQQPGLEKGFRGSGEMAQSVKCLPCKHKDQVCTDALEKIDGCRDGGGSIDSVLLRW